MTQTHRLGNSSLQVRTQKTTTSPWVRHLRTVEGRSEEWRSCPRFLNWRKFLESPFVTGEGVEFETSLSSPEPPVGPCDEWTRRW